MKVTTCPELGDGGVKVKSAVNGWAAITSITEPDWDAPFWSVALADIVKVPLAAKVVVKLLPLPDEGVPPGADQLTV